ncbi:hypothetical protein PQX77_019545 [Marasmius sp. AFHP31]|nr:hypothetical protein PQX77_019545 [Marasmius sp. AFHP31]
MSRPQIPRNAEAQNDVVNPASYSFNCVKRPHRNSAACIAEPVISVNNYTFTQDHNLPTKNSQFGFREPGPRHLPQVSKPPIPPEIATEHPDDTQALLDDGDISIPLSHSTKQSRQSQRWLMEVIPQVLYSHLHLLRSTDNLHNDPIGELCAIQLYVCDCCPAAVQLMHQGLFPSAPCFLTLAVDIRVLEFVRGLFLRVAPNHWAWCDTVMEFLNAQGYRLRGQYPPDSSPVSSWPSSPLSALQMSANSVDNDDDDVSLSSQPSTEDDDYGGLPVLIEVEDDEDEDEDQEPDTKHHREMTADPGSDGAVVSSRQGPYYQRLYTLDCQVEHADKESLWDLGIWIAGKQSDAYGRVNCAKVDIKESGRSPEFLREQWEQQKAYQTKPLPKQSKQRGKKAVEEVLCLRDAVELQEKHVMELQGFVFNLNVETWEYENAVQKLPDAQKQLDMSGKLLAVKEGLLGVKEKQEIKHLLNSSFLRERMNAMAIKSRLVALLQSQKFQQDCLERSF